MNYGNDINYKILVVARSSTQKDRNTTVVQNLIAQRMQSLLQGGTARPPRKESQPVSVDVMRLQSWEPPPSLINKAGDYFNLSSSTSHV